LLFKSLLWQFFLVVFICIYFFFFSSRRRHTRLQGDWSSDVCSSDLYVAHFRGIGFSRSVRLTGALKALFATLFCFALGGCLGYHIGPVKPYYLRDVHTIAVPTFKNRTLVPRIEVLVTDTVIKQLQQDGTFEITNGCKADATLSAEIARITRAPARSV